ncbi:MAG: hypothetical protein GX282_02685 [Campylobacteraceae bacterium]|nr:hypothetical protein [Campylobacteraceae bacterium]
MKDLERRRKDVKYGADNFLTLFFIFTLGFIFLLFVSDEELSFLTVLAYILGAPFVVLILLPVIVSLGMILTWLFSKLCKPVYMFIVDIFVGMKMYDEKFSDK